MFIKLLEYKSHHAAGVVVPPDKTSVKWAHKSHAPTPPIRNSATTTYTPTNMAQGAVTVM